MKKTILIPIDFTIESLTIVKSALEQIEENQKVNIILLHGAYLTDFITDLLFFSKAKFVESKSTREFNEAIEILKNKYASQIDSIRKDVFTGSNQSAFNNYLEANNVDEAYIPKNYKFNRINKRSFDLIPYIKKSKAVVTEIESSFRKEIPEKGKLAEIFYNGIPAN
ncbi:MAG: hypothetical protein ACK4K0_10090 [Flavobacteriales bacterium]